MKKVKVGDMYIVPKGTKLWIIPMQQTFISTKMYVIKVTKTLTNDDKAFFGDLYDVIFQEMIPGLLKVIHGETYSNLDEVIPLGDLLEPKIFTLECEFHPETEAHEKQIREDSNE